MPPLSRRRYALRLVPNIAAASAHAMPQPPGLRRSRFAAIGLAAVGLLLSAPPAMADAGNNFEGAYQIGASRCTVRPVKMAFELRCPRSRLRTFFFVEHAAGKTLYESGGASRRERFEFTDEVRGTGRFFRADGQVLPIRRIAAAR